MRAGGPSICHGTVFHRRLHPTAHEFTTPVSSVWFDPDEPASVAAHHPLWSSTRLAPARFRAGDYGDGSGIGLGDQVRDDLAEVLGGRPGGPIRMLTQWRRWGWLFNPITVYVAWAGDDDDVPSGVVLEVTNTPWKERHRYASALHRAPDGTWAAAFDKVLHVSPFLDEDHRYEIVLSGDGHRSVGLSIDVIDGAGTAVLVTAVRLRLEPATHASLGAALRRDGLPTHRVSAGIHAQAARLWRKGVPFVAHPRRRRQPQRGGVRVG